MAEANKPAATGAADKATPSSEATTEKTATGAGDGGQQQQVQGQEGQAQPAQQTAQAADAAKTEGEQEKKTEAPQGAPEKYEDFKAPEGVTFDKDVIGKFSEVAKELNLPQDKAQLLLDKMGPTIIARQAEQLKAVRAGWQGQAKVDKEFGGDKLTENLAVAKKAIETFGTPELRTLLDESGLGDHPEVIRFAYRAGKAISEDGFVAGRGGAKDTDARALYPGLNLNP
jgi:hypothetical protein